jgi:carbamoyltransferase
LLCIEALESSVIILGLNAFHGDSSAALVRDGKLIAAAEEERFCRIKHWAGFPLHSISYCLNEAGVQLSDIEHIALNQDIAPTSCARLVISCSNALT